MRFVWQPWNVAHLARHDITTAQAEALFRDPHAAWHRVPGGSSQIRGQVEGHTYRAVFLTEGKDTFFVITCHREHPTRRFP